MDTRSDRSPGILLILGPSGVGKSSVIDEILRLDSRVTPVAAYTTRAPRKSDAYRVSVSDREFDSIAERELLLAKNVVFGARYGTPARAIVDILKSGRSAVADCPADKISEYQTMFAGLVYTAFLQPPSFDVLRTRLSDGRDPDGRRYAAAIRELLKLASGAGEAIAGVQVVSEDGDLRNTAARILSSWAQWLAAPCRS